jgi:hypothetical protein
VRRNNKTGERIMGCPIREIHWRRAFRLHPPNLFSWLTMNSTTASTASSALLPLFALLTSSLSTLESTFYKIPGSQVVARYVKSSHQNDPGRSVLELILVLFAIRTLLKSRTRTDRTGKHFISFSEKVWFPSISSNLVLTYCGSCCGAYRKSTN